MAYTLQKFVSKKDHPSGKNYIEVLYTPSKAMRFIGVKESVEKYIGSASSWYQINETGGLEDTDTTTKLWLCGIVNKQEILKHL